jgi:cytochrome d ubiquinol oxidase subunit I
MSHIDPLLLARIQFGFTISFHIVFPAITIGLGSYLAVLEGLWLLRQDPVYLDLYHFWSKAFAVNFAMGVVSGLVMSYEFGTNWSYFSTFAGGVTGPLLAYEVLTAFFLEAGFLGVMLFGWRKVGPGLHFFATLMVAAGTLVSMTWILASNSWMQTPQGYAIVGGRVVPTDWLKVIFNPSFPYRLVHMGLAAYLATALFVGATGAWHLLKHHDNPRVRTMFSMAMWMVLIVAPLQILAGDQHGRNTLEYQPAKVAAMEGHWSNTPGESVPLILFGWPDMADQKTLDAVEIPHLGSLILTHSWNGQIMGLDDVPAPDRPDSTVIFWTFRIMVGLAMLMLLLGLGGAWFRWRGTLYHQRLFLRFATAMGPAGIIAILAGWITTEVGRQPWVVYGVMRTADAVAHHSPEAMGFSLGLFVVVYCAVFGTGITYLLRVVATGPERSPAVPDVDEPNLRPARPLSAAPDIDPSPSAGLPMSANTGPGA